MGIKAFYCPSCKLWVTVPRDIPTMKCKRDHRQHCTPFDKLLFDHPDLADIDAHLEYFFNVEDK